MSSIVKTLQDEAVTYLGTVTDLAGIPIIGRRRKNIVNDVAAQIAGQRRAAMPLWAAGLTMTSVFMTED